MLKSIATQRFARALRICFIGGIGAWIAVPGGVAVAQAIASNEPPAAQQQASDTDLINPDRPGIADGSAVIGRGRFQLETGFQEGSRRDAGITERTFIFPALVRIGLSPRWEARFESNTFTRVDVSDPEDGATLTSELAPISLGFKYHIQDSAGWRRPSVGTIVRFFPVSGTGSARTHHATGDARLAADWDLTPNVSLNPNIGVAFYEDGTSARFSAALFALTANYFNVAKTVNPFVDMGLQAPEEANGMSSIIFDAGIAYLPRPDVQLDASFGTGPKGRTPPRRFVAIGISFRFHATK